MNGGLPRGISSVLERNWLFQALPGPERERLLGRMPRKRFAHGGTIFAQGDPGSSAMVVVEGRVRIGLTSRDGREVLLGVLAPGELFGELALLDGKARSADATALGACVLLSLDRRDLLDWLRRSPEAAIHLFEVVCGRVRAANDRLEGVALLTVEARLARLLLDFAERDRGDPRFGRIDRGLSQSDLAHLIGSSSQTVNQHLGRLGRWADERIIARDGSALLLRDPDRLREVAEA
jgi:CRP/FNR family transcriptional regulator, cyclic AMP receptor protein